MKISIKFIILYLILNINSYVVCSEVRGTPYFQGFDYNGTVVFCWETKSPHSRNDIITHDPPNKLLQTGKGPDVCNLQMALKSDTRFDVRTPNTLLTVDIIAPPENWIPNTLPQVFGYFIICRSDVECSPFDNNQNQSEQTRLAIADGTGAINGLQYTVPLDGLIGGVRIVAVLTLTDPLETRYTFAVFHYATIEVEAYSAKSHKALSSGAIAGIIIGIIAVIVILAAIIILYCKRRKNTDEERYDIVVDEISIPTCVGAPSSDTPEAISYAFAVSQSPPSKIKSHSNEIEYIDYD